MPEKRIAIVYLSVPSLVEMMSGGIYQAMQRALPRDAKVLSCWIDQTHEDVRLGIRLEHESFGMVMDGAKLPVLDHPVVEHLDCCALASIASVTFDAIVEQVPEDYALAEPAKKSSLTNLFEGFCEPVDIHNPDNWEVRDGVKRWKGGGGFPRGLTEELIQDVLAGEPIRLEVKRRAANDFMFPVEFFDRPLHVSELQDVDAPIIPLGPSIIECHRQSEVDPASYSRDADGPRDAKVP